MRKLSTPAAIMAAGVLAGGLVAAHDLSVPTARQLTTRGAVFAIERYRARVSPHLGGRIVCRFRPTCSAYGLGAVKKYGGVKGGWRAVKRIARCNPTTPLGTLDLP